MEKLILVLPIYELKEKIDDYLEELDTSNQEDKYAGMGGLEASIDTFDWIDRVSAYSSKATCPDDKVPSTVYLAVREEDEKIVGIIDLRHHIDHPVLSTWGGHIGYNVRPSEQNKGYAKEMLRIDLEKAKSKGIDKVLVTCNEDNIASEKVILANGGEYEKSIDVDGKTIKRYWISI